MLGTDCGEHTYMHTPRAGAVVQRVWSAVTAGILRYTADSTITALHAQCEPLVPYSNVSVPGG